jgi:hypothetical protein
MEQPNIIVAQAGFLLLTFVFFGLLLRELKIALPKTSFTVDNQKKIFTRTIFSLIGWFIVVAALSLSGFIQDFTSLPPKFLIVIIIPLIAIIIITFSKTLKEILGVIPPQHIIRLQVFRVFVELLLWFLFIKNVVPVQMTFEGRNFDVLAGLTSIIVAYLAYKNHLSKTVLVIWNVLCLGLLINIVAIALLSAPTPFRVFMNEPANTIVAYFPVVLLPAFLVPLAYGLHFFSLRQLLLKSK